MVLYLVYRQCKKKSTKSMNFGDTMFDSGHILYGNLLVITEIKMMRH